MKRDGLVTLYALILLVVFGGIVLHAPLSVGLGTLFPDAELLIKSWKELLLLFAVLLGGVLWRDSWRELVRDRIVQVAGIYMALHALIAAALLTGPLATLAGLAIDVRYILFFVLVYILVQKLPVYRLKFLRVGAAGAAVVLGFAAMQLFLPADILTHIGYSEHTIQPYLTVDENPDYIRINSTLRGPNPLGAYTVIVIGLIAAALVSGRVNLRARQQRLLIGAAAVASLAALWCSYSRSALGAVGITLFLIVLISLRHVISRRMWIAGAVVFFGLIGGIVLGRDHPVITNVVLHENREGGSDITSNDAHLESLVDGTERMLRQPIGAGIGSTGSASLLTDEPLIIENQYLFIAHEVGWLGLGLFLVLSWLIFAKLWQYRQDWLSLGVLTSGIGLAAIGLLQPVWVDDTVSIVWWGLAAIALGSKGRKHGKQSTK